MANIKRIDGKTGPAFKITVTNGTDANGKQIRHYKTFRPAPGMTKKQAEKAAKEAADEFERQIGHGFDVDRSRMTFAEYAEEVLKDKERTEVKHKTLYEYRKLTERIYPEIGNIKLEKIQPIHIRKFYDKLAKPGERKNGDRATAKIDMNAELKARKLTRASLADLTGVSTSTISAACRGQSITLKKAEPIAAALNMPVTKIFTVTSDNSKLSGSTMLAYHRFIHMVLKQAKRERIITYNVAENVVPPKLQHHEPNYFQPEDIAAILDALETEPLKWRLLVHLLIVTGCRRGEILGLKWDKIDLEAGSIQIDATFIYTKDRGVYESTTKTGNVRTINIPYETVRLLREWRRAYLELQLANGDRWQNTGCVFVQDNGKPIHPDSIAHWLTLFSERHNLPHINAHAFRHTYASVLLANETDIVTVSKSLGHLDVSTTTSIYSHLIEKNRQKAADCIANVLLRQKQA